MRVKSNINNHTYNVCIPREATERIHVHNTDIDFRRLLRQAAKGGKNIGGSPSSLTFHSVNDLCKDKYKES